MPRDGTETYILPFPDVVADTTIESPVYNGFTNDVAQDLNNPRPIVAGGTGATSAAGALAALGGETATQLVTNYDSYVFKAGSFYSAAGATAAPTANAFSGICYLSDANNIVIEARDSTTGILYVRRKVASVWGAFAIDGSGNFVELSGDTMTGALVLPAAAPTLGTHATNKTYVDAADDNRVRFDAAQSLNATQKRQAASNQFQGVTRQYLTATGTYTTPAGVLWIEIELIGGGGGGAGSGTTPGNGGSGAASTFGTGPILSSGIAGGAVGSVGGAGAVPSGGSVNKTGCGGGVGSGVINSKGGTGGTGPYGGNGDGGGAGAGAGMAAVANSGAGGGGGGVFNTVNGGGGGAAGGFVCAIINSPLASYGFVIGAGGAGGTAGTGGAVGGAGGSGGIIVTEHYSG